MSGRESNRCYRLRQRPEGRVSPADLEFVEEPIPALKPGQALGVDVDFENVGGVVMDEVFLHLNIGARVVLSGMISQYESSDGGNAWAGKRSIGQLIMRRASMTGFLVLDHPERFPEAIGYLAGLLAEGRLHSDESVVEGLGAALDAVNSLFDGGNTGKLLVRLGDAELPVPVTA